MVVANIEDLRQLARHRLPRAVFDFVDGGAQDEVTLKANQRDFLDLTLLPRVLVDVVQRDQSVTVLGQKFEQPLILAPTGGPGLLWPNGAIEAARAADSAGVGFCLSTMSTSSIEEVSQAVSKPFWFQLYVMRDRGLAKSMIERARKAGCTVLVLTVDLALQGQRDRDVHNTLTIPFKLRPSTLLDFALHPGWAWRLATGPKVLLANFLGSGHGEDMFTIAEFVNSQFDQSVTWSDIEWAKSIWGGPLALKGILNAQDAKLAAEHGVDAVIVSNHGGRQLDCVPSAISALREIVEAVDGRMELILDGGVRRGTDIIKAMALGANACMIGRPFLYGLASSGRNGVAQALEILRNELDVGLALVGRASVQNLDHSVLA